MGYDTSKFKEFEVSFGYSGIKLVAPTEIEDLQLGYSIHPDGESLVGEKEGDWQSTWIVIGNTTDLGDPIFVDTCTDDMPVFTAIHGQSYWAPELIADSYESFLNVMSQFSKVASKREHPEKLENNPMTQKEYDDFIEYVRDTTKLQDTYFWELLISDEEAGIGPEI